jgi:hypothetical protein
VSFAKASLDEQPWFGPTGRPLHRPVVTYYVAGSSALANLYTDEDRSDAIANPVIGDDLGMTKVWLDPGNYVAAVADTDITREIQVGQNPAEIIDVTTVVTDEVARVIPSFLIGN